MRVIELKFHYFYWEISKRLGPVCSQMKEGRLGSLITCYLLDTDLDFSNFVLENLKDNEIKNKDLGTECWGADLLDGNIIEMRALYDYDNIDYIDYIKRADFTKIIEKWRGFLELEPDENYEEIVTFEIEELDREKLLELWGNSEVMK